MDVIIQVRFPDQRIPFPVDKLVVGLHKVHHLREVECLRLGPDHRIRYGIRVFVAPKSRSRQDLKVVFRIRIHWARIRIQQFRLNTDPDPGFWWPKIEKNFLLNQKFIYFISKSAIYLSLCLHQGPSSERRSFQHYKREHPALQNMKFLNFFYFHFSIPGSQSGSFNLTESGSFNLTESGSNPDPDPDPKHCFKKSRTLLLFQCGPTSSMTRSFLLF
jgi:hypothetical protein